MYVVLAIGLAASWYSGHVSEVMHTRARYTIGYLTGGIYTPKSGKKYSYNYRVQNKVYEATDSREDRMNNTEGARFLVEYDSLNPEVSDGHFAAAVPDSILDSPPNGWKTPPVPIPKIPAE
jgi:hypothetical protein